jgi:surface protein
MFLNARNLTGFSATDGPVFAPGANCTAMFQQASSFNDDLDQWNTSNVTNMSLMFLGASAFNGNIATWDTGNVSNMYLTFNGALAFNQPIGNWNVSNVTTMAETFYYTPSFNQDLDNWDTGNVTSMAWMFANTSTTAQRGALDWRHRFRDITAPVFEELYQRVASGEQASIVIKAGSDPEYRKKLDAELTEVRASEIWRAGDQVRALRPQNQKG